MSPPQRALSWITIWRQLMLTGFLWNQWLTLQFHILLNEIRAEKCTPASINMLFRLVLQPGSYFFVTLLLVASVNTTGNHQSVIHLPWALISHIYFIKVSKTALGRHLYETSKKNGVCVCVHACVYLAIYPLWALFCRCNFRSSTFFFFFFKFWLYFMFFPILTINLFFVFEKRINTLTKIWSRCYKCYELEQESIAKYFITFLD